MAKSKRCIEITQFVTDDGRVVGSRVEGYMLHPNGCKGPSTVSLYSEDIVPVLREALENIIVKHA